ncbi:permease [Swingsia samuiensis]|uniref:Permease n=2 Tax=Swingsia samuiensis TaxID=1293412 RepID=A0A4Y6UMY9_9PROT|nr:permease [Swingsia samuiensis]
MAAPPSLLITISQAILPILVTLGIGYFAAYRRTFDTEQATVLTRLVMLYALPLELFVSILTIPKTLVLSAGPIAALILFAMLGGYLISFILLRSFFKKPLAEAAVISMTITGPAVPFIGIPVLGQLFGASSAVPISIAALAMNLIQLPITMILMNHSHTRSSPKAVLPSSKLKELIGHLEHACREPVVWAPLSALILVCLGFSLPQPLKNSFMLLGHTTGGAALFASGVVLFARQIRFSALVGIIVFLRNLLIPFTIYLIARSWGITHLALQESVLTMAIPSASINVILALRYRVLEREIASVLFFGTTSSIFTMAFFIWLTQT